MHPSKSLFLLIALHVVFADNFTNFSCFLSKRKECQKLGAPEHNAFPFRIYYSPTEFTPPMFALSTGNNYRRLKVVRSKGKESYILYRGTSHHFYTTNILQTDKTSSASMTLVSPQAKGPHIKESKSKMYGDDPLLSLQG